MVNHSICEAVLLRDIRRDIAAYVARYPHLVFVVTDICNIAVPTGTTISTMSIVLGCAAD